MRLFAILLLALFAASTAAAEDADFCASPAQSCGGAIPAKCLSTLGAGSVSASQDCASHLGDYRECLASVAERCSFVREEEQQQPKMGWGSSGKRMKSRDLGAIKLPY